MQSSRQRQFLYFLLLLSKGIGPMAIAEIRRAIDSAGQTEDQVGAAVLDGYIPDHLPLKEKHSFAMQNAISSGTLQRFRQEEARGNVVICPNDNAVPTYYWQRATAHQLPPVFIAKGQLPPINNEWVAVIGSRNASPAGLARAAQAGCGNALEGRVTVSGGARGVDTAATTSASTSGGFSVIVPAEEVSTGKLLERQIMLSPYAPGTRFTPGLAMARNKVVVALSHHVIVAEINSNHSSKPSGTAHAVQMAELFGVPVTLLNQT